MLFSAVGQGYIFLLLLCVGAGLCVVEIVGKLASKSLKNITKIKSKKIAEKSKKIAQNRAPIERKIEFVAPQKNTSKNKQKNNKKNMQKISPKYKKIAQNVCSCMLGVGKVLVYGAVLFAVVLVCDFGELRAYHFLAFLIGFWLTKTIFAKLAHRKEKCAKL